MYSAEPAQGKYTAVPAPQQNGRKQTTTSTPTKISPAMVRNTYRDILRRNIEYDSLVTDDPASRNCLDEMVEIMTDTMLLNDDAHLRISRQEKSASVVKSQFMRIGREHILYVQYCLEQCTSRIYNIKAYLMTCLYNAPLTMSNYYSALVQHDMAVGAA